MNFSEAVAEVVETSKRPDLIGRIRREINAAVSFYCADYDWDRDLIESSPAIDATEYTQAIALSTLTRFRKFKYIRRAPKAYLTLVGNQDILKGDPNCLLQDKYYIVGDNVNLALARLASSVDIGYYAYPPLLSDGVGSSTHWLLDMSPYMIIDRALGSIFASIGDEKSAAMQRGLAREAYLALRANMGTAT
jgi:hypothetical protein